MCIGHSHGHTHTHTHTPFQIPTITQFAPQDKLGTWLGYNASIETITGQFGPFILALIYEGLDATKGTTQIMLICAGISGVSTLMAIQTVIWFPPQCKKKTVREVTPYLCVGLTEERDGKGSGLLKKENALIIDAYNTRFTAI